MLTRSSTANMRPIPCNIVSSWTVRRIAGNPVFSPSSLIYTDIIDVHLGGEDEVFEIWKLEAICNRQIENNILKERRDQKQRNG